MPLKLAINGFGRIGRTALRAALPNGRELGERLRFSPRIDPTQLTVIAINDLAPGEQLADLLKYDSVYGVANAPIVFKQNRLIVGDQEIAFLSEPDPEKLPWSKLGVDVVLECTGFFADFEKAQAHLAAGAKKVIISADAQGDGPTVVLGTESAKSPSILNSEFKILSNASCTTNCIAPIMQILEDNFGVVKSLMTTTHAYTATQSLVDGPNDDPRRARAAAVNAIPTTTGAAKATVKAIPELAGKFDGIAIRVPLPCASLVDITAVLEKKTTVEELNQTLKTVAASEEYQGIVEYSEAPLVSSDIIGNPHSAVIDAPFTRVIGGDLIKILAWYDNEWAYSCRLVELAQKIGKGGVN